jgi:hypothetical protein
MANEGWALVQELKERWLSVGNELADLGLAILEPASDEAWHQRGELIYGDDAPAWEPLIERACLALDQLTATFTAQMDSAERIPWTYRAIWSRSLRALIGDLAMAQHCSTPLPESVVRDLREIADFIADSCVA